MLAVALSLVFVAVIAVTGVAAAVTGGLEPMGPADPGPSQEDLVPDVSGDPDSQALDGDPGQGLEVTPVAYNVPGEMRAVYLTPGQDFFASGDRSEAKVKSEIDAALQKIQDLSMNTVVIQTASDKGVVYDSANLPTLATGYDPLGYAISAAKGRGLYVYCIYNLLTVPGQESMVHASPVDASVIDRMEEELISFVRDYKPDGILLADYENPDGDSSYGGYLSAGGGIGYQRYMRGVPDLAVRMAADIIHTRAPGMQAGLLTTAVWANQDQDEAGSKTNAAHTALVGGNADVRAFVKDGLVDFVAVEAVGSQSDPAIPFNTVTKWWGKTASEAGIPLYLVHGADRMGTSAAGWGDSGQLVSQLVAARETDGYKGSMYNSLSKLSANPGGATTNLLDYLKDQTAAKFILATLEMTRPAQATYTTSEPTATLQGASDPRSEVLLNGQKIETSDTGYFSVEENLKAGLNTFKIEHKGKTLTYNITRQINVIDTIAPEGALAVEGGMQITVSVNAYDGAAVSATLGGKTIALTKDTTDDDNTNKDSSYVKYSGVFTAPAGTTSQQGLGNITISATYEGYTGSKQGASVTVNKRAVIGSGKPVVVSAADAETFPTNTLDDISSANYFPLPKGALDYTQGNELSYKDGNTTYRYYILESGQRVYSGDISSTSKEASGNQITGMTVTSTAAYTDVILKTEQQVSYRATYSSSGMKFAFQNTTSVPGNLSSLSKNPLFKSATWSGTTLSLNFRVSNGMVGYQAYYDKSGNLVLRFHNVPSSLGSAKIVVDPGHGGTDYGALGYLSDYPEKVVNWQIARRLASVLESRGANVLLINTQVSSGKVDLPNRMNQAYNFNPQAFVSIHNNSSTSKSATGHEAYYFYSFSQGLASQANSALGSAIGNTNRGTKYGLYYVTRTSRFAATLTEGAFMSNQNEFYDLIDSTVQQSIANEMADAIESFFDSRYAGSYPTGSESVGKGVVVVVTPTALTLDKTTLELALGQAAQQLTPKFEPADTTNQAITWTSSDEKVAKVDSTGKVTPVAAGTATITATSQANTKLTAKCTVTVKGKAVTGVAVDPASAAVAPGGALQLKAVITPADAANQEVTWSSNNPAVTVSASGLVTVGSSAGSGQTAAITVKTKDGDKTAVCQITVGDIKVTGISLNKSTLALTVGGTEKLTAAIAPANATNTGVTWTSSDSGVAAVSASGEVTAKGPGTAAITAESKDGGFKATCQVTVQAANVPVTGVSVSPAALTLEVGGTGKLTATVAPTGATDPSVTWSSDAPGVVTVDENGSLKALAAGTAVITAKSKANPSASAACTVTVNAPAPTLKSITINLASATLKVGDTLPAGGIPYTTDPADYGGTAAWASSNTEVLSFDGSQFQAVQAGSAEIILTIDGVSTRAAVTVQDSAGG